MVTHFMLRLKNKKILEVNGLYIGVIDEKYHFKNLQTIRLVNSKITHFT